MANKKNSNTYKGGKKSKYSTAQKKAYYSGMGYAAAYKKKEIPFKNEKNKQSFREGFKEGIQVIVKYPNLK